MRFSLHTGTWHEVGARARQSHVTDILVQLAKQHGSLAATEAYLENWRLLGIRGKVLDIGCGAAQKVQVMQRWSGTSAFGCDLDIRVLRFAKHSAGIPRLAAASGIELPFASASFDWITASEVIEHLSEPSALLCEAHRVLKPGGRLLLTTPNRLQYYRPWRPVLFWRGFCGRVVVDESHVREFSARELQREVAPWFTTESVRFTGTLCGRPLRLDITALPRFLQSIWAQGLLLVARKPEVSGRPTSNA